MTEIQHAAVKSALAQIPVTGTTDGEPYGLKLLLEKIESGVKILCDGAIRFDDYG